MAFLLAVAAAFIALLAFVNRWFSIISWVVAIPSLFCFVLVLCEAFTFWIVLAFGAYLLALVFSVGAFIVAASATPKSSELSFSGREDRGHDKNSSPSSQW